MVIETFLLRETLATYRALYCSTEPFALYLILYTHLHPIGACNEGAVARYPTSGFPSRHVILLP